MRSRRRSTGGDGLLHAVGLLTVLRVPSPSRVDRSVAGFAMAIAPLAAVPLGAAVGLVCLLGDVLALPPLVTSYVAVGVLALGSRALHWDGLADTVDGLTASYSAARSLEVMRTGTSGPAGVLAIVVVASLQAAALAALLRQDLGWVAAGLLVVASRSALTLACVRGVPPARAEGLGALHIGSVSPLVAGAVLLATCALCAFATALTGNPWSGLVGWLALVAAVLVLVTRCVRRLGGITGDVLGASVEVGLAALLVAATLG